MCRTIVSRFHDIEPAARPGGPSGAVRNVAGRRARSGRLCGLGAEEKNSVAITSNESFSGWTETFTDLRLCAAIVDRLTFSGNIIETGTDSYRLATTRARAEQQPVG